MNDAQRSPFVWRLSLASAPESVFELLDTTKGASDSGRCVRVVQKAGSTSSFPVA
jgi:hypothetical protein